MKIKKQKTSSGYHTEIIRRVDSGLRYVDPYEYTFSTFAKGRWVGRSLVEVFQKEFVAHPKQYYEDAIKEGRITVNHKTVNIDYTLQHNDAIAHRTKCIENPVSGDKIETVHESSELLVVSKPSSLPVHACGGYRLNTLISIIENERGDGVSLFPTHRIDRLTSGLVILGKNRSITRDISELLTKEGTQVSSVSKEYLALAKGKVTAGSEDHLTVTGYIQCIDMRVGKYVFSETEVPESKWSETHIQPIQYFPEQDETLVVCKPVTGRTHQIRLHLQAIGHPLVNDICYGGSWDPKHPFAIPQIPSLQYDTAGKLHCGGIFLHAWRYKLPSLGLQFEAPMPQWTREIDTNHSL